MDSTTTARPITPLFLVIASIFIAALIAANIIAVKLVVIFDQVLPAAIIIFPISYIMGDVLTEVYGYRRARTVIWLGFVSNLIVVGAIWLAGQLPAAPFWQANQQAYETILGFTPRILIASFAAYLVGEFANSLVLSRMKIATQGRWLWARTIGSTFVGQGLDSAVFITIAFWGIVPDLWQLIWLQWFAKVAYEIVATPFTYVVVGWLKQSEGIDHFDHDLSYDPLGITD